MKNMRKILALTLVIVSVLAIAIPAFAARYTTQTKVNTNLSGGNGGTLNLRSQPDGNATVLAYIPNGATIYIDEQNAIWVAATYQGVEGYVMRKFLEIFSNTPTDTSYTKVFSDSTLKKGHSGNAVWNL